MPPSLTSARLRELREKVRAGAKNRPGTYRMVGSSGVVIYVGKSKRLRTRLMGYFRARQGEKGWRIVREAHGLEWEYAPSEFASLLRELELIKRLRPPFNVRQKRDALFSFLRISPGPAPRLSVARAVREDGGRYFGPLRGGKRIVEAVRELNDVLALRDCRQGTPMRFADQAEIFPVEITPLCPRVELRRCCGPCAAACTEHEYAARLERAREFLEGTGDDPIRQLDLRMRDAVERLEFEHAAGIRERIARLEMLRQEFARLGETVDRLSFLYAVPGCDGDHRIYALRGGTIRGVYPAPRTGGERATLLRGAAEHFAQPEAPHAVSRRQAEEILLIAHWFRIRPTELERAYGPERWESLPLAADLEVCGVA
jgi:excinuclease ABC subunit C